MLDSLWRVRLAIPRRQVALFLLAIVVPSAVLVVMAGWMTVQDRELAKKRAIDERQRQTEEIRQSLLAYLERLKLLNASGFRQGILPEPPVALVARIDRDRLVLPWDQPPASAQRSDGGALADAIRQGEAEELVAQQPAGAAVHYSRALSLARTAEDRAYARLLLARAWTKAGRQDRAGAEYAHLLDLPADVIDEHGVPMWAYAAQRLSATGDDALRSRIVARIEQSIATISHTAPTVRYLLRDLLDATLARSTGQGITDARPLRDRLDTSIRAAEQALALQTAFPLEGLRDATAQTPTWVLFGDPAWLVSSVTGSDPILVAVPMREAIEAAVTGRVANVRLLTAAAAEGDWMGEGFAGMKVAFDPTPSDDWGSRWPVQRWFAWLIVVFSLTVTAFGAYFLWRDVRREVRMAALRSQFVSSVSHELKTPLTAIRMFAETLRLGRAANEETAAEYLDTIVNESERLTRLLNNVLEFSKMERGATHFRPVAAPLDEPVRRVVRAMSYPLAQQGFTLIVDVAETLPRVLIDPDAIEQALLNLLANAMKYSGDAREIALRVRAQPEGVVIEVTDHGIGIAAGDHERIFEKFYRAATPENRHIPGTGLGLTLVDHIARAHGGSVRVTSAPGQGSTFSLVLPVASGTHDAAPSMAPAGAH